MAVSARMIPEESSRLLGEGVCKDSELSSCMGRKFRFGCCFNSVVVGFDNVKRISYRILVGF